MPAVAELAYSDVAAAQNLARLLPCSFHPLSVAVKHPSWSVYNPSVCRDPAGGYRCLLRYSSWPQSGVFPTQSHLLLAHLDSNLEISSPRQLEEPPRASLSEPYVAFGPEDARLFRLDDQWFASATFSDTPECYRDGRIVSRIGLLFFDAAFNWTRTALLPSPDGGIEKNWMPIEGELAWLYAPSRTVVARYDAAGNRFHFDAGRRTAPALAAARGGTQLVEIAPNRLLGVIHETATALPRVVPRTSGYCRAYTHRFVLYSRAPFELLAFSPRFYFLTPASIEFAAGLVHDAGRLLVSFGHHDRSAWLAAFQLADVLRILISV